MSIPSVRALTALAIALLSATSVGPNAAAQSIDPAIQATAHSTNEFAVDLYQHLRSSEGNLFFSPYSIDTAMAMVHAGAAGATADEIGRTPKLPPLPPPQLDAAMAGLSRHLRGDAMNNGCDLHIANAMWGQIGNAFSLGYINRLRVSFDADLIGLDFSNPQASSATINEWASNHTGGLITNLLSPLSLRDSIRLILTNAIYFNGSWTHAFDAGQTHRAPWNSGYMGGGPGTAAMMFQTGAFDFLDGTDASAIQMPYSGGDLSMLVLLPHAPSGLGDLEKKLTLEKLKAIIGKLHPESEVDVSFPKFKLDASVNLRQALTQMGMPTVFSNSADLSGIDGAKNLFVTDVIHRAYVRVDETGTEAATATAVPIAVLGGSPLPARPTFCADHPFLFVIMDRKNGTILFIGRVVHPAD